MQLWKYVLSDKCSNLTVSNFSYCKQNLQLAVHIYRVIQEESAILREMIVCVILSKKVYMNMCPILDGYGVMGIF